jgi:acyl-CoA hydrolase
MQWVSAADAVAIIQSGDRVFIHTAAAAPQQLVKALTARAHELRNVEIVHLHTEGVAPYAAPEHAASFHPNVFFVGPNLRTAVNEGNADYIPVFLSEVPNLFRRGILPLDVALVQLSPPDKHGYCSLGVSVDTSRAAVEHAKQVIAQINPNMPRTHGDGLVHIREIDFAVATEDALPEHLPAKLGPVESAIARYCADLVDDGATLQMGIGAIPDAILSALVNHHDLGIHSEMISDGIIDLFEKGVINGRRKRIHPGKMVGTFAMGTRRLYDFIDDNPVVTLLDVAYVNDTSVIRRNPKVTAINSAIEVDLTGQVVSDSIGTRQYSGVGGQMDFIRGAALAQDGKPIIALPSTTGSGISRIVPFLQEGAGVVTTRAHVHYVITEYGVANLYGKNLRQRARALIDIAHPDHRAQLTEAASMRFRRLPD